MKIILLLCNYIKFPLVKVIISKIAYKSLINTKKVHFLRTGHRNFVRENFFRGFGDMTCIKNLFKQIRFIDKSIFFLIPTFNLSYCNEYLGIRYSNFHRPKSLSFRIIRGMIKSKSMQFWMNFYVANILVNTC